MLINHLSNRPSGDMRIVAGAVEAAAEEPLWLPECTPSEASSSRPRLEVVEAASLLSRWKNLP